MNLVRFLLDCVPAIEPLQTDMVYSNGSHDDDHHHTSSETKQQDCQSKNSGSNNNYGVVPPRHHPCLSTWNPPLDHGFSAKQMEALICLCDALVPSLQASSLHHDLNTDNRHQSSFESLGIGGRNVDDVNAFYKLSASEAGVPPIVAGMLTNVLKSKLMAISILLWLLSTAIGTFLLGGWATMSKDFPYIRCYSQLESKQQEMVLQGWSLSSIPPFRAIFKLFKSIVLWAYYCKIDTNGDNPTWKAIGYCGPDPQVASANLLHSKQISHNQLGDHVINAKQAGECLKSCLSDAGCCMIKDLKGFTALDSKESGRAAPNSNDIGIECDVVIVGSGSGGGVVAAVLAEKGYKVVVLDKGEYYAPDDISTLEGPSILSLYEKSGALATEDGGVSLAAARTIGGGSTVNWCVCFKTPENVRNEWVQDFGLQLFASEKYEQAMEVVWKRLSVQEVTNKHNLPNSILQNGCKRLGLNFGTLARNSSADHYCGWCSFGCPTGQKQSTPETWLLDAVKTNNTLILSNCEAQQILHSPNLTGKKPRQALGVMATMEDGTRVTRLFVKASATIVACGSLMTPPLLLNSGLENKNIGKNLHLHPAQAVWGIFPEGSGPEGTSYEGGIMTAYSWVSRRDSSSYGALLETLCLHPGIFAAFIPWCSGMDAKQRMLHYSRTVHICSVTRDKGSGSVRVDQNRKPIFDYTLSDYDEETMMIGVDQALRVLVAAGATQIGTHQFDGECFCVQGAHTADLEAYLARVRQRGAKKLRVTLASAHQLGSCQMGMDPQSSAVDPQGETWEVQGLFLGDGSLMPTSPVVRASVPRMILDDVFEQKNEIAKSVEEELEKAMRTYGYEIVQTLIVDIEPDVTVKRAMNEINAAARMRVATREKAEAEKTLQVKRAEGEAEAKYLAGVGIARQRQAIVDGLRESVLAFSDNVPGTSPKEVMDMVLVTQYFDTMKEIGASSRNSTVFIPYGPGAVRDVAEQIRNGLLQGEAARTHLN